MVTDRQPIALDPQLYGEERSPFRSAPPLNEFGWVRVVLHGGVAPIIVDGVTVTGMARPAGHLVRVETGRHYVAVRGSGTLYTPSQVAIEVSANDTADAVFSVPQAIITAPPVPAAPASEQGAAARSDSASGDSVQTVPPPAAARPDSVQPDTTRPDTTRPDTTRIVPPSR
jgi:hypothetical protein